MTVTTGTKAAVLAAALPAPDEGTPPAPFVCFA